MHTRCRRTAGRRNDADFRHASAGMRAIYVRTDTPRRRGQWLYKWGMPAITTAINQSYFHSFRNFEMTLAIISCHYSSQRRGGRASSSSADALPMGPSHQNHCLRLDGRGLTAIETILLPENYSAGLY